MQGCNQESELKSRSQNRDIGYFVRNSKPLKLESELTPEKLWLHIPRDRIFDYLRPKSAELCGPSAVTRDAIGKNPS